MGTLFRLRYYLLWLKKTIDCVIHKRRSPGGVDDYA
jgi:hypothetical protein